MSIYEVEPKNIYVWVEETIPEDLLCFTANTASSTVKLQKNGSPTSVTIETSTDGITWSTYTIGDTITLTSIGDDVYFRNASGTDTGFSTSSSNYYQFVMTGSISASGNINYLLNKNSTTTVGNYGFYKLFDGCTSLTTAPQLPATDIGNYCYQTMFLGCTSMTTAPSLPATTVRQGSYYAMFNSCINMVEIPKLPATTLGDSCYNNMFYYCRKIKVSTISTGIYTNEYRIPTSGTGTAGTDSLYLMFYYTDGTFTGTPTINTTYYTSNTVV